LKMSGRSLVWLGHQLPKLRLNNFDLNKYRGFLFGKYSAQYARLQYCYVVKYGSLMDSPSEINNIPLSIRGNVLKSLINLSKYLGKYESVRSQLKNYGIKWVSSDNSFNSFLAIVNNNYSTLGAWYSNGLNALSGNEKLWLKFALLTRALSIVLKATKYEKLPYEKMFSN